MLTSPLCQRSTDISQHRNKETLPHFLNGIHGKGFGNRCIRLLLVIVEQGGEQITLKRLKVAYLGALKVRRRSSAS